MGMVAIFIELTFVTPTTGGYQKGMIYSQQTLASGRSHVEIRKGSELFV